MHCILTYVGLFKPLYVNICLIKNRELLNIQLYLPPKKIKPLCTNALKYIDTVLLISAFIYCFAHNSFRAELHSALRIHSSKCVHSCILGHQVIWTA